MKSYLIAVLFILPLALAVPAARARCNCSWTSTRGACSNDDGSACWWTCCKGGTRPSPSQPTAPTPTQPTTPTATRPDTASWPSATTTRYYDCCKPSCAWQNNVGPGRGVVRTCGIDGTTSKSANTMNVCGGGGDAGPAYMCLNQQAFVGPDTKLYGFVATKLGSCCDCFELVFQSGPSKGKSMFVQKTNTGGDLGHAQFDIQVGGGGEGIFRGCSGSDKLTGKGQFASTPKNAWGAQYGGVGSKAGCSALPAALQKSCQFRFDNLGDNPSVKYRQIACPPQLSAITGCKSGS